MILVTGATGNMGSVPGREARSFQDGLRGDTAALA
jgi:hypothetical protein